MTTTLEDLISSAVATYKFRRRLWNETPAAYRVALIQHVEMRDFSAANEIRLGKPIHEWTPEEIAAYRDRRSGSAARASNSRQGSARRMRRRSWSCTTPARRQMTRSI